METWLRQNIQAPKNYKLSAETVQGLQRQKALHDALEKMREGEKKVYQRSFLQSQKMRYDANMGSPAQRQLFGSNQRMTNQDLAEAAMQAPASLAGLSMMTSLGLPGTTPVLLNRPTALAPGAVPPAAPPIAPGPPAPMTADASTEVRGQKEITKALKAAEKAAEKVARGTPAKGTPAKGTPAKGTPATGTPAAGTPGNRTPGNRKPGNRTPPTVPSAGTPVVPIARPVPGTPQATTSKAKPPTKK